MLKRIIRELKKEEGEWVIEKLQGYIPKAQEKGYKTGMKITSQELAEILEFYLKEKFYTELFSPKLERYQEIVGKNWIRIRSNTIELEVWRC